VLVVWKGAEAAMAAVEQWGTNHLALLISGVGLACGLLSTIMLLPYLYQRLVKEDWRLRWYHYLQGPLLLRRGRVIYNPRGSKLIPDYYKDHKTKEELTSRHDVKTSTAFSFWKIPETVIPGRSDPSDDPPCSCRKSKLERGLKGKWYEWKNIIALLKRAFFHGINMDVAKEQKKNISFLCRNLQERHAEASKFDNKAEHAFSYLQVLTAATASFANGANDISK
jgi:solute carrier family 20 (sodium-dependent phosphate transporter)